MLFMNLKFFNENVSSLVIVCVNEISIQLDECCQLSSQLIIPEIGLSLPARGLASPILFNQLPLQVSI